MQFAQTTASKALVAVVAAAMMFSAFAMPAKAQTTEELQAQIAELMAQISALQGQGGTSGSVASGVCPFTWTRDLSNGSTGADVMKLQQFLNANADTRVAASGAGSVGMETEYYGPATAAAVSKFQVMHRADILTPAGLVNPTGYFGPSTRAKANALCVASTDEDDEDEDEDEGEDEDTELQGEGTLDNFEMEDADDTDIQEGAEDEVIGEITAEATDGDIEVDRITFTIVGQSSPTEADPWDVFDTISLWVDGEMIADFDSSDEDAYLDEDDGEFRFSGLGLVLPEDEEVEILVGASVNASVDGAGTNAAWQLTATDVRYFDADGVASDEDYTETADFDIVEEGDGEELNVKSSSADPDAAVLQVEDDQASSWYDIFVFNVETEEAEVELDSLVLDLTIGSTTGNVANVVDDLELVIDGTTIDDYDWDVTADNDREVTFDIDGDVTVGEDESVEVVVRAKFKAANGTNYASGETINGSIDDDAVEGEGSTDITSDGTSVGETHELLTEGVFDVDAPEVSSDGGGDSAVGTFTFEIELEAFENTAFLATTSSATALNAGPFRLSVVGGTATSSYIIQSDATVQGGYYRIDEGDTEVFTITVSVDPVAAGSFYVELDDVRFKLGTPGAADKTYTFTPASDFDTTAVSIKAN